MSNNKGNIKLAFKTFLKDLHECKDYQEFKANTIQIIYENRLVKYAVKNENVEFINRLKGTNLVDVTIGTRETKITLIQQSKEVIHYRLPEIDTKENRDLNKLALKQNNQ